MKCQLPKIVYDLVIPTIAGTVVALLLGFVMKALGCM
jgi:hypothetical protein